MISSQAYKHSSYQTRVIASVKIDDKDTAMQ